MTSFVNQIILKNSFGIRFDQLSNTWEVIIIENLDQVNDFSLQFAGDVSQTNKDASWLILASYSVAQWTFTCRTLEYVFESVSDARFFVPVEYKNVDMNTGLMVRDSIKVLRYNVQGNNPDLALGKDYLWNLTEPFRYSDGYIEPRRVKITFCDVNNDNIPDDPTEFDKIIQQVASPTVASNRLLFWKIYTSVDGYQYYAPFNLPIYQNSNSTVIGDFYSIDDDQFYNWDGLVSTIVSDPYKYYMREGRSGLAYQWKHYANPSVRIDPSPSNIIDAFVLTNEYWQLVNTWKLSNGQGSFPTAPDTSDMSEIFSAVTKSKTMSDTIVWRSANFKLLFGEKALPELQAQFVVVKVLGVTISDNQIKQSVIQAIDSFFDVNNWDFGESFNFTQLSTWIHQSNPTTIAQVVIVPISSTNKFGTLFEIRSEPDELFLSTANVNNVLVVANLTASNIRIGI